MRQKKIERKYFAMFLIFSVVMQGPSLSKADYFGRGGFWLWNQNEMGESFHIQYFLNGGSGADGNPLKYERADLPVRLEMPEREGYYFAGWYADSHFLEKINQIDAMAGNYKLYAKWTKSIDSAYNVNMYPYQDEFPDKAAIKRLKDYQYSFLEDIKIPGMPATKEADYREKRITDTSQCPQGICASKEYLFISSYSSGKTDRLSCIHMFDKKTGNYLASLGIKRNSHLGGLAFDGTAVWVCHSESRTLERIPYSFLKKTAAAAPQEMIDCSGKFREYHVSNTPSCIAYYDGKLWTATHTKVFSSVMVSYQYTKNGLSQTGSCRIPDKVQGIAFDETGKVYLSSSYGRKNSSYLKVYASCEEMNLKPEEPQVEVEMPPCSEEIEILDRKLCILFESAGEKYLEGTDGKGRSICPIDEIVMIGLEELTDLQQEMHPF